MSALPVSLPPPRLQIQATVTGQEVLVRCSGRLIAEYAEPFKTEVRHLIPGAKRLVLDFTQVEYMDSSGLGAVVRLYVSARSADCEFVLVNFNQRVREVLSLTRLLLLFEDCGRYNLRLP